MALSAKPRMMMALNAELRSDDDSERQLKIVMALNAKLKIVMIMKYALA